MNDPAAPPAAAATRLAKDWPLLQAGAATIPPVTTGTIGRTPNVHGIPGGTEHHTLAREVRDTAWGYTEVVHDVAHLDSPVSSDLVPGNLHTIAVHAGALETVEPLPCTGHGDEPRWHANVTEHLECLAHRVRLRVEPRGARVLVGPCPTTDDGTTCEQPLRAAGGSVRCPRGHVHDTAAVRDMAAAEASKRTHTLRDITRMSPTLWGRRVKYDALEKMLRSGRLTSTRDPQGRHLVRVSDVAAVLVHGRR